MANPTGPWPLLVPENTSLSVSLSAFFFFFLIYMGTFGSSPLKIRFGDLDYSFCGLFDTLRYACNGTFYASLPTAISSEENGVCRFDRKQLVRRLPAKRAEFPSLWRR